jgi:fumarate hydratase class II
MNMNEVLARLASQRTGLAIHPNDHVNCCQSSNDVVPAAIQLAAGLELVQSLLPALQTLEVSIRQRAEALEGLVKTGRTHLMDAMPVRIDQEMIAWAEQIKDGAARVFCLQAQLLCLPLGGTAVGTGVNAHPEFAERVARRLSNELALTITAQTGFRDLGRQDLAVDLSGRLNSTASSLMKIANDLRWMNSGPLAGLGEIQLPALQPGSSIMPGKVNPVIAEALAMVCAQVSGNNVAITIAAQSGNFQLNVMMPLIARNLLESIKLLANGSALLAEKVIDGLVVNEERLAKSLASNPMLVTALNQRIGYTAAGAIAKRAMEEQQSILAIALEDTDLTESELRTLLDPLRLTNGGIP